jgi:glucosamine kinase
MSEYFIGIDGGGTSCKAAIADRSGRILGSSKGGAANILTDIDGTHANIVATAKKAISNAGLAVSLEGVPAFLGLAGANIGEGAATLLKQLPFKNSRIALDGLIALQGALGNDDGIAAILGTGSVYIARHEGTVTYRGGWGFKVGDLGAGARLGQALLQECLLVHDGIHKGSPLVEATFGKFDNDATKLVAFAHAATPGDFGRFAPSVFEAAESADTVALLLLGQAAMAVNEALDAALGSDEQKICLLGGLASLYPAWLAERHRKRLVAPKGDALNGAISLAISTFTEEAH